MLLVRPILMGPTVFIVINTRERIAPKQVWKLPLMPTCCPRQRVEQAWPWPIEQLIHPSLMDHAGSADMLALGTHCSVPECQQIDFLPFTCDCCGEVFCLQHRTYQSHSCSKAGSRETSTIVCPICAKAVKLTASDDPNAVFERHTRQDCDPANYAKVHQRPKCPAKGCREKLGTVNTYTCKECGVQVCLKHRFPETHQCPGKSGQFTSTARAPRYHAVQM